MSETDKKTEKISFTKDKMMSSFLPQLLQRAKECIIEDQGSSEEEKEEEKSESQILNCLMQPLPSFFTYNLNWD